MPLLFVWLVPRLKSDKAIWLTCILAFGLTFANGGFSETMAALQPDDADLYNRPSVALE